METLDSSETLDECLAPPELGGAQNTCGETLKEVSGSCVLGEGCTVSVSPLVAPVEENGSGVDSVREVDVSTKGISLFVEVFGSLNGGRLQGDDSEHVLVGNNPYQEYVCDVNGGMLLEIEKASMNNGYNVEQGGIIGQEEEWQFNVGDFVWARVKSQLWWPGVISDGSKELKAAAKCNHGDGLLVRCFGNGNYMRFLPSQLKPFVEYFEQMKGQKSNSNVFRSAIDRAVAEFGRCVKRGMTCSCFSGKPEEKVTDLSKLSVAHFEPASFLEDIKHLARGVSMPSKIDYIVTKNRLSAFYRSLGHSQIPMHQLKPASDVKNNVKIGSTSRADITENNGDKRDGSGEGNYSKATEGEAFRVENGGKAEKSCESRERRKSRYLSYPYVNHSLGPKSSPNSGEPETENAEGKPDLGVDIKSSNGQSMASTPMVKCKRKKSPKKPPREHIAVQRMSKPQVEKSLSSSEVLSELRCTALDCLYANECENIYSAEKFLSKFRKAAFCDFSGEISNEHKIGQEPNNETYPSQSLPQLEVQPERSMPVKSVVDVKMAIESPSIAGKDEQIQLLPQIRGRKRKEKSTSSDLNSNPSFLSDLKGNVTTNGPVIIDFQNAVSHFPEVQSLPGMIKEVGTNQGNPQLEVMPTVSVVNGNSTILNFEDPQVAGSHEGKLEPKRRKIEGEDAVNNAKIISFAGVQDINGDVSNLGSVVKGVPVLSAFPAQIIHYPNITEGIKGTVSHLDNVVTSGTLDFSAYSAQSQISIPSPGSKPEPKKRGRKKKTSDLPDLNGNSSENKPEKIKRRRKSKAETGTPCVDLTYKKLHGDGEDSGTALLLKFVADNPLPTKESLISAFTGFGSLKESETEVFTESTSAQLVFLNPSSAGDAFRSLQNSSPFGESLVNYRIQVLSSASRANMDGLKAPIKKLSSGLKTQKQGEAPDIPAIRKNLEMMTSMLEKERDNLSPELREKLEKEIQGLLKKVTIMTGSSSS